jgi:hypothetical protein
MYPPYHIYVSSSSYHMYPALSTSSRSIRCGWLTCIIYMYIYVHTHTHTHTHAHTCICDSIYIYIYICMHIGSKRSHTREPFAIWCGRTQKTLRIGQ